MTSILSASQQTFGPSYYVMALWKRPIFIHTVGYKSNNSGQNSKWQYSNKSYLLTQHHAQWVETNSDKGAFFSESEMAYCNEINSEKGLYFL